MLVHQMMTRDPSCCTPNSSLNDVAHQMIDHDCGAIPVIDSQGDRHPVGIITDRDIVVKGVANTLNLESLLVRDCMTEPCITIHETATFEECCKEMKDHQIRRIVVVDDAGRCVGIVAQADIARVEGKEKTAEMVRNLSKRAA